jgi:CheY-like chemotaxis protein
MEPAKILLVEDEPQLQRVLARTLEQIGYRVATAGTEAAAVQAVLQEQPDVLVLDNNLPDGTGWGVLRRLAGQGITCASLPTILMSAGEPAPRRVAEFRPQAFLPTPFPVDALKRLISEALAARAPVPKEGPYG